jgi:pimeloyl-ACP methyl ester carboxylesterase
MLRSFGDTLFGEQYGSGPPSVVALPGWMRQRSDFRHVLEGFDAVALDLPGFGGPTPEPPEPMGAEGYARLVAPVLDHCAERVVLLGHSFGGRVAVHLATSHPERVKGLVLTGVPLLFRDSRPARPPLGYRVIRRLHRWHLVGDARMEKLRTERGSADYRNASGVMRGVLVTVVNESYEAQLAALRCPVTLVWGDDDADVPVSVAERALAALGERGSLSIVPGAGHLTPLTAPSALRTALHDHLA